MTWVPASVNWVVAQLQGEMERSYPSHETQLRALLVTPHTVPVDAHPGETVVVVAERDGSVLYWSDFEDGWELEPLSEYGGIPDRGCNQYELSHITHQIFGDPRNAL